MDGESRESSSSADDAPMPPVDAPMPPVDVPLHMWRHHPALRHAQLNPDSDGITWPEAKLKQIPNLQTVTLLDDSGTLCARMPARFNFDLFVDEQTDENAPAYPPGHTADIQRFYTRVTESGFCIAGLFCATTAHGRRKYFQWLTTAWVEIGLAMFIEVRDSPDTDFAEVTSDQVDEFQYGATSMPVGVEIEPRPDSSHMLSESNVVSRKIAAHRLQQTPDEGARMPIATKTPMNYVTQVGIATAIATIVHRGHVDLEGEPSIDHVGRVAESFDVESMTTRHCAAWLHDVLEVGNLSEKDLIDAGVSAEITNIVSLLTRRDDVDEDSWLAAILANSDARAVKIQTVADNSARWRLRRLDPEVRSVVEASCAKARDILTTQAV